MKKIEFTKMVASGNDFVVTDYQLPFTDYRRLALQLCDRKFGVGADGLLILSKSRKADIRMRIFNADGSEAEMCGNGARCAAFYFSSKLQTPNCKLRIETKAGIIKSEVRGENVRINLTEPKGLKLNIPLTVFGRKMRVNFVNTGVPHAVVFVQGLSKINVQDIGRALRNHKAFAPAGTNVDFVEVINDGAIRVRTYERGVEDETLACGTGSVASALITNYQLPITNYHKVSVTTKSGEVLKVYFNRIGRKFNDVWLEGSAKIVYKGEIYV